MNRLVLFAILGAMVLGVVVGWAVHQYADARTAAAIADNFKLLSASIFLPLIKMVIAPLVISTLTVGIAHLGSGSALGRIGVRTMGWFITASLVSLTLGLIVVNILKPGVGFHPGETGGTLATASFSLKEFLAHVFPTSVIDAMARNEMLQIVVFCLFLGVALQSLGEKSAKVTELLEQVAHVMLKVTGYVMMLAPLAVFGAMASSIATQGLGVIADYGRLVGSFFLTLFILWAVLIFAGFLVLGPRVFKLMATVREPALLAFSTASSEAAYPKLLEQLEKFGIANRVVSFVLPLGYSFNLDGSMMYCTFAAMFIAQANGLDIPLTQQIVLMALLFITSKGIAGVPRASLVVIAATLPVFNLPEAGLLLIIGVDHLLDMGRSATNVVGNSVAAVMVSKWEKQLEGGEGQPAVQVG
jgi:Na+/H+-dicarboxylate symporter